MNRLYKKLAPKKIPFTHVCEVGVYIPETSNVLEFINDGVRATLVEADPEVAEKIRATFTANNVRVYPVAVWDTTGTLQLSKAASSTFATALPSSPARENDRYRVREELTFEVPCVQFSEIDDGTIDLLSIDAAYSLEKAETNRLVPKLNFLKKHVMLSLSKHLSRVTNLNVRS